MTIQTTAPATAAPISAQAHPGKLPDSDGSEALCVAAAAPAAAAAGAWLVEVVVVVGAGVVTVWVWTTVFVCVGAVTVVVCVGAVTVLVCVTVVVGVVGEVVVVDFACADTVAVWFWEDSFLSLACVVVAAVLPGLASPVTPSALV